MPRLQVGLCSSMTPVVYQKLQSCGVCTVLQFVSCDLDTLAAKSGVSFRDLISIRRVLLAQHASPVVSGTSFFDSFVASASILSTGCSVLDELLDGGLFSGEITELFGSGSAKVCLNTIFTVASVMKKNILYFDAANHLDLVALNDMSAERRLSAHEVEETLKRIRVIRAFTMFEILSELNSLSDSLSVNSDTFFASLKLVVVSGIPDVVLPAVTGCNDSGCGYVAQFSANVRQLASEFSLAILLCTNVNVQTKKNVTKQASVWHSWMKVPGTRVELEQRGRGQQPAIHLTKCTSAEIIDVKVIKSNRLELGQSIEAHFTDTRCCCGSKSMAEQHNL